MDLKIGLHLSFELGDIVVRAYADNGSLDDIASESFSLVELAKEEAAMLERVPGECEETWLERLDQASINSGILRLAAEPFDELHMEKISHLNDLGLRWDDDWDDEQRRMYGDG